MEKALHRELEPLFFKIPLEDIPKKWVAIDSHRTMDLTNEQVEKIIFDITGEEFRFASEDHIGRLFKGKQAK